MKKEEIKKTLEDALAQVVKVRDDLQDIVWEGQEGQSDHFDTLPKVERIVLIENLHNAKLLANSLHTYIFNFTD